LGFYRTVWQRVKDSGLKVKDYFINLVKADIALHQTQQDDPVQDEAAQPEPEEEQPDVMPQQDGPVDAPEQDDEPAQDAAEPEEMMNLFVKITKEQRAALEAHKLETGETVGSVLNPLIDGFLDHTDSLPEGFEDAYSRYSADVKSCDTTCSAKIPASVNQELTDYLSSFGGSRNALMASLVELCLTAFMQTTLLFMGLITFSQNMLLGLGIMLSASEVPRIAQQFGLDTTVRFNVMNVVHATTTAVNLTRSIGKAVAK
jgi:hypothetical protein